jgi:SNF2 family DNA or RNA helicase
MRRINIDFTIKTKPFEHQIEAINYVKNNNIIPLFDEQGLGKTKIVIDALCENLKENLIDAILVVCRKSLMHTWEKEVEKHTYLHSTILSGSKTSRGRHFMQFSHFYLINYESFIQELERIKVFLKLKKFAIVLDESQTIKNPESKITQSILSIRNLAVKKIIITGTPITNRPEDIWSQFYFLDDGKTLGNNFSSFKREFHIDLKGVTSLENYENKLAWLNKKISKIAIRRTKNVLELPEKKYIEIFVNLNKKQMEMYETLKKELYLEVKNTSGKEIIEKIENYLVKLLRLTQIASNPLLIDESYKETPSKFIKLDQILTEIINRNEKAIVWTSFVKNIRSLRKRYEKYGALMLFGDIPIKDRNEIIDKFMENKENKILVANPAAAKEGLTLISANNAIYLDRSFKMDDYIQSQDRIHRIGQEKECNIIKLIAKNTIDEYTDEIIEKKNVLAKFILGDLKTLETQRQFLNKEDLLKILG